MEPNLIAKTLLGQYQTGQHRFFLTNFGNSSRANSSTTTMTGTRTAIGLIASISTLHIYKDAAFPDWAHAWFFAMYARFHNHKPGVVYGKSIN